MQFGYDFNDPIEREMYIEKKKKQFESVNDNTKTIQEKYIEYIKERQKETEYFFNREKIKEQLQEQIEKQLPDVLDKTLAEVLKGF